MASNLRELEAAFSQAPSLDSALALGKYYLHHSKFLEATVVCKKGLKLSSNHPQAQILLAEIYFAQGKAAKARPNALSVWEANPCAEAAILLGKIEQFDGNLAEAIVFYKQAVNLEPGCEPALAALKRLQVSAADRANEGRIVTNQEQIQPGNQAKGEIDVLVLAAGEVAEPAMLPQPTQMKLSPPSMGPPELSSPFISLNEVFSEDDRREDDLGMGDGLGRKDERSTFLGFVPGQKGSLSKTISMLCAMIVVTVAIIYGLWANAQRARQVALLSQQMVTALNKDTLSAYDDLLELGKQLEAIDSGSTMGRALIAYTYSVLATEHAREGALERATMLLEELSKEGDRQIYGHSARAQLTRYKGENAQVWDEWQQQLRQGGIDPWLVLEVFLAKAQLSPSADETIALRARLMESLTYQSRAHHLLGWYFVRAGEWGRALAAFDRVINNSPNHVGARLGRAITLMSTKSKGAIDEISALLNEVGKSKDELKSSQLNELYQWLRAELLRFDDDPSVALGAESKRQEILANSKRALFFYREGRIHAEANDATEAIEYFEQASILEPTSVEYALSWVQVLVSQNEKKQALAVLKKLRGNGLKAPVLELLTVELQVKTKSPVQWSRLSGFLPTIGPKLYAKVQYFKAMQLRISGKSKQASQLLETYIEDMPSVISAVEQAALWCELGNAYWVIGEKKEAFAAYQLGLDNHGDAQECLSVFCARSSAALRKELCQN